MRKICQKIVFGFGLIPPVDGGLDDLCGDSNHPVALIMAL